MPISFRKLKKSDFPLLLQWLETPHVKKWWDSEITYTLDLIRKKYDSYVHEYTIKNSVKKSIQAYIINVDKIPAGFLQLYNAHDFFSPEHLLDLPDNLGALDLFIGEEKFIGRGIGSQAILKFLSKKNLLYDAFLADPDVHNQASIKCFKKAGFQIIKTDSKCLMIKHLKVV